MSVSLQKDMYIKELHKIHHVSIIPQIYRISMIIHVDAMGDVIFLMMYGVYLAAVPPDTPEMRVTSEVASREKTGQDASCKFV
jgi:hypothetical protein